MKGFLVSRISLLAVVLLLAACGATSVVVESDFPQPLVRPVPLNVGVYYSEDFSNYIFVEKVKPKPKKSKKTANKSKPAATGANQPQSAASKKPAKPAKPPKEPKTKLTLEAGKAQVALFDTLFQGFFANLVRLEEMPVADKSVGLDVVIQPELEKLQYATPRDTKSKVYEVWLKYRMNLYTPEGAKILNWPLTAYGKTPVGFMKSKEVALERATVVALRDAGAHFASSFNRRPEIQRWLEQRLQKNQQAGERQTAKGGLAASSSNELTN